MHRFAKTLPTKHNENYMAQPFFLWKKAMPNEMIEKIHAAAAVLPVGDATVGTYENRKTDDKIRISNLSWIHYNEQHKEIFDFMQAKIDSINYWHFGFKLTGMEGFQYTRYAPGGHYKYHNDVIAKKEDEQRKLSVVVSLTDPLEYDGGNFLLNAHGDNPRIFKFDKGDIIAFPSYVPHKVEPVQSGGRVTLVAWVVGPKFV